VTPEMLTATAADVGEKSIISRTGGAPTLAVGMAQIFSQVIGGKALMAFWYHFAILFEALFILTAVDAGTRAGRFMLQDLMGAFVPSMKRTESWAANAVATALCVAAWGYFVYQGVIDPLGGIYTFWPLFGIANQMLAGVALLLCVAVLFKMKRQQYAWVAILPATWLLICTLTAGYQKVFDVNAKIGFLSHAQRYSAAMAENKVLAPAKDMAQMQQIIVNDYVNSVLCLFFMFVVVSVLVFTIRACFKALKSDRPTDCETPAVPVVPQTT
jgi:carbon starvation protein